jgi:hypothetical protein
VGERTKVRMALKSENFLQKIIYVRKVDVSFIRAETLDTLGHQVAPDSEL